MEAHAVRTTKKFVLCSTLLGENWMRETHLLRHDLQPRGPTAIPLPFYFFTRRIPDSFDAYNNFSTPFAPK